jgi:hypothetical protein
MFHWKRSKKTKDKLRRAATRRVIDSLRPQTFRFNRTFGKDVVENQWLLLQEVRKADQHHDLIKKALIHILEGELR